MKKRMLSIIMAVLMVVSMLPTTVLAADADNLCDHHLEHTAECGYAAAVAGADCTHVHDDICGYATAVEEVPCACVAAEDGTLTHTEGCGYVAAVPGSDCTHSHDELCGYVATVEEQPCTYECMDCAAVSEEPSDATEPDDTTTGGEENTDPAVITGLSITVDGVLYTEGNVTITPTSTVTLTVTGTSLHNGSDDHTVDYANGLYLYVNPDYFEISEDGTTATYAPSTGDFAKSSNFEIAYCNNYTDTANRTVVPTGIYLTYDDGIAEEDKARITGMSITVDGKEYTEGEVIITPETKSIIYTVSGTNFANLSADNVLYVSSIASSRLNSEGWTIDIAANTATGEFSEYILYFRMCNNFEVTYSNDGGTTPIGTGIYLTYDDGIDNAEITGVSITVDGETYTEGEVIITPTSTVLFTLTGTNFNNLNSDQLFSPNEQEVVAVRDVFTVNGDTAAEWNCSGYGFFESCNGNQVLYSNVGGTAWVGTGIYLTYNDGIAEEDKAVITGVSITVDGETYSSGNVTITPSSTYLITVTGTNFANMSADNFLEYASGAGGSLSSGSWTVDAEANTATQDVSAYISYFEPFDNFEIRYSNDGRQNWTGTGIYLTYDNGIVEEDKAVITGVSITVDGETYSSGEVIITPDTQSIIYTVTGTNFANLSADNCLFYASHHAALLTETMWYIDTAANTATHDFIQKIDHFAICNNTEVMFSNDDGESMNGTGIYLTYDDGIAEEDKARISGVSVTVDGKTYTEGNITITPTSTVVFTLTGTNFANMSAENLFLANGYFYDVIVDFFTINAETNSAVQDYTTDASVLQSCDGREVCYSNDGGESWNGTGIYLTYDDGTGDGEDTTPAEITGVSITVDGETYTEGNVTITPTSTVIITVTGTNFANVSDDNLLMYAPGYADSLNRVWFTIDAEANTATWDASEGIDLFANCDNSEVMYSNDGSTNYIGSGIYLTYDAGISEEDKAVITGVSITVDGVTYNSGNVTITPATQSIIYNVTGTNFANVSEDNVLIYAGPHGDSLNNGWPIDAEANTATFDASEDIDLFAICDNFEVLYSNDGGLTYTGTGIYLTFVKPAPDSTGKIVVDMTDYYGDGWNGAAIEVYKNGSLETTATVDQKRNTVSLNYDSAASYEFKWVEGEFDAECIFTIYVDGELMVKHYGAAALADGETLLTLGDDGTGGEENTDPAVITGVSITGGYSIEDGEVYVVEGGAGITVTVTGENFAALTEGHTVRVNSDESLTVANGWTIDTEANTAVKSFASADLSDGTIYYRNPGDTSDTYGGFSIYMLKPGTALDTIYFNTGGDSDWTTIRATFYHSKTSSIGADMMTIAQGNIYATQSEIPEPAYYVSFVNTNSGNTDLIQIPTDGSNMYNLADGTWSCYDPSQTPEDTTPAVITGVSITVDGKTYTEGNVTITPGSTYLITVSGTNFANVSADNFLEFASGAGVSLNSGSWTVDAEANTATQDVSAYISYFEPCNNFEIRYSNDGRQNWTGTGIYLTYDNGIVEEDKAQITGVSITVDGVTYTEGNVTITPTSTVVYTVTGTNFANINGYNVLVFPSGVLDTLNNGYWNIDADTNTATRDFSGDIGLFEDCDNFEVKYSNDGQTGISTGIYLTYGDGIAEPVEPIVITKQPTDGEAKLGERYCVEVIAEGEGLTYQWYLRNAGSERWSKSSVTDNTYDDVMTKARMNREVYCVITDANGNSVTTNTVFLKALKTADVAIVTHPESVNVKYGERFTVTVEAVGDGLTYQWFYFDVVEDAWCPDDIRSASYSGTMTEDMNERAIYCVVTDIWGDQAATDTAVLTGEKVELAINQQPNDASAKLGEKFCVAVEAEGNGLTYKWYYRKAGTETWTGSGVRDNTYDDVMTSARHNREVYCVITDMWGNSVTTETALITGTATTELAITRQPENHTVAMGDMFNVTFEAVGDNLKYQWYFRNNGSEKWSVSGQRDNSYDDVMTKARHNRSLYCVVTDAWGNSVTTEPVVVIMATQKHELQILQQPNDASAKLGEGFCVTVEAQGDELKYQWYYRQAGTERWITSGVRDNTYDDIMTKARHNRQVYCVITDMWGNTVETEVATITGTPTAELAIVTQPTDAYAAIGENYCVTVEAQGDGLKYQWYFRNAKATNWSKSSVTDNTYDDVLTKTRAGREVYCVITDAWGKSVTTDHVFLRAE